MKWILFLLLLPDHRRMCVLNFEKFSMIFLSSLRLLRERFVLFFCFKLIFILDILFMVFTSSYFIFFFICRIHRFLIADREENIQRTHRWKNHSLADLMFRAREPEKSIKMYTRCMNNANCHLRSTLLLRKLNVGVGI